MQAREIAQSNSRALLSRLLIYRGMWDLTFSCSRGLDPDKLSRDLHSIDMKGAFEPLEPLGRLYLQYLFAYFSYRCGGFRRH